LPRPQQVDPALLAEVRDAWHTLVDPGVRHLRPVLLEDFRRGLAGVRRDLNRPGWAALDAALRAGAPDDGRLAAELDRITERRSGW
jgi:hypothetical protein